MKKILAISSSGGHWVQLMRLSPLFTEYEMIYCSTDKSARPYEAKKFFTVRDASMWNKFGLLIMAGQILFYLLIHRPNVIITTGAAPGYFAIVFGKMMGIKTIWLDSIANVREMSLAGKKAKYWADLYLTQWPDIVSENGPRYMGAVL